VSVTVRLTVVPTEAEAEIICDLLRAEAVACSYVRTDMAVGGGTMLAGSDWTEIRVFEEDLPRARGIIESAEPLEAECVECGRPMGDDGRWYSDGTGELLPYCAGCDEREFGLGS
jgi:hypothetical protein